MNSIKHWDDMNYWSSDDWRKVQERLDEAGDRVLPVRECLFSALDLCSLERTRVVLLGQDSYCSKEAATGVAFSVPKTCHKPPTLRNILAELKADLHYEAQHGDLTGWCEQGVLLWNVIPSVLWQYGPLSCSHWEWSSLTKEILLTLTTKPVVFVLMGVRARSYSDIINHEESYAEIIETGHPSPLAQNSRSKSTAKFIGSRVFSRVNELLTLHRMEPIDWSKGLV
jgi:uracil-DNA glycosylase